MSVQETYRSQSEYSACVGKQKFKNHSEVLIAVKRMRAGGVRRKGKRKILMRTYQCRYCGGWHIGN